MSAVRTDRPVFAPARRQVGGFCLLAYMDVKITEKKTLPSWAAQHSFPHALEETIASIDRRLGADIAHHEKIRSKPPTQPSVIYSKAGNLADYIDKLVVDRHSSCQPTRHQQSHTMISPASIHPEALPTGLRKWHMGRVPGFRHRYDGDRRKIKSR